MHHTITALDETLTLTAAPSAVGLLAGWEITVSHPDGGHATFNVIRHEARFYVMDRPAQDCPLWVRQTMRNLFCRASGWYARQLSHANVTIDQAIAAAK